MELPAACSVALPNLPLLPNLSCLQESQQKRNQRLAELRAELVRRGRTTADIDRMLSIAPVGAVTCEFIS